MYKTPLTIQAEPFEIFGALCNEQGAVFLESQKPSVKERYSFIAWEPERVLSGDVADLNKDELYGFISSHTQDDYFVAGYIGYEACRWMEDLPAPPGKDTPNPSIYLAAYPRFLAFDHIRKRWYCGGKGRPASLPQCRSANRRSSPGRMAGFNQSKSEYLKNVGSVLDYIKAGDVYQINYTQRAYFSYPGDCYDLYLRLKKIQPVSYAAFINVGKGVVVSGSPELFLRLNEKKITSKPMKGTRSRSQEAGADRRLRCELKTSKKDQAENVMIVDLMRNDLGRFCAYGSIRVPNLYVVEAYDTVYQMVSHVSGVVGRGFGVSDIIRSTFPPGSITGAPKKRAMEIIYELEPNQRGVYCGAIGYFYQKKMVLNVAIRTLELWNGHGVLGIGGGIVADSDPELEYEESIIKAKASMMALGIEL